MKRTSSRLVNVLGGLGYGFIILQWVWLIAVMTPWFMTFETAVPTQPPVVPSEPIAASDPSPVALAAGVIITVIVVALMLYVLSKLPTTVATESSHIVHKTSEVIVPVIAPKRKLSQKARLTLSSRVMFGLKILLAVLPFLGLYGAMMTQPPISEQIISAAGFFLLCWSFALIVLQRIAAHVRKVNYAQSL